MSTVNLKFLRKKGIIDEIKSIFDKEDYFLILTHKNADVDAVGSVLALKYYLKEKNKNVAVGCESLNRQAKILVNNLEEKIDYYRYTEEFGNVIILDTSSMKKLGIFENAVKKAENVVIIDHHEKNMHAERYLYYNEPLPSNAEIIYKFFPSKNEKYFKAILAGIIADTGRFKYANVHTFETVLDILKKGTDFQEVLSLLKEDTDRSKKIAVLKAFKRMKIYTVKDLIIATTRIGAYESIVARSLLDIGADISFVAGRERISSRAKHGVIKRGINLAEIMHKIGKLENGDGGGHKAAAGAENLENAEKALKTCVLLVKERLDKNGSRS